MKKVKVLALVISVVLASQGALFAGSQQTKSSTKTPPFNFNKIVKVKDSYEQTPYGPITGITTFDAKKK